MSGHVAPGRDDSGSAGLAQPATTASPIGTDRLTAPTERSGDTAGRRPSGRARVLAWLRWLLLLLVVLGAGYTLVRNWETVADTLGRLPWEETVLSQLAVIVGIGLGTLGWSAVVDGLGQPVGIMRGAQINLVGQLGKYVPGSVWAYLLQMELGRRAGVARARVFTGSLIQAGVGLVTAVVFAVAALPMLTEKFPVTGYLVAVLPFALVMLHPRVLTLATNLVLRVLRRPPLRQRLSYWRLGKVFGLQLLAYGFFGLHLWLLARTVGAAPGAPGLLLCAAAISIGLNAGMFVFLLPSGVGVRDGVIVAVLISALPYSPALAFAVVSRVMFLVADLLTAGAAAGFARWRRPLDA